VLRIAVVLAVSGRQWLIAAGPVNERSGAVAIGEDPEIRSPVPPYPRENAMSDDFNMTMRKFLKQVGVTSQQAIEDAMRQAGTGATTGRTFEAKVSLTIPDLELEHVVTGSIVGRG